MLARPHAPTDTSAALDTLAGWLASARHVAVLTGAGMSTESGIPDFRSYQGRYTQNASLADVLSIDYFLHNPAAFWEAFKEIFELKLTGDKQPNAGHRFLAWLAAQGKTVSVLTQNIDGLHQRAGSEQVVEVHGTLQQAVCPACGRVHDLAHVLAEPLPRCLSCHTALKPDVVLYGEAVHRFDEALTHTLAADVLLVLGSSLEVGPINLLPLEAQRHGIRCALINLDATRMDRCFDLILRAPIGQTAQALQARLEGGR